MAAAASGCSHRPPPPGPYARAVAALSEGRSADHYTQIIALAHQQPDSRAGRRARAILCSGSGTLEGLLARAQAANASPDAPPPGGDAAPAAPEPSESPGGAVGPSRPELGEAPAVLSQLAVLQRQFHQRHHRYCRDFVECPLVVPAQAHYFYFLSEQAVTGGSDSEATVEAEADIRAWLLRQRLRPHPGAHRFLAVAVGLLGSSRVDVWTLNERGQVQQLGQAPSP